MRKSTDLILMLCVVTSFVLLNVGCSHLLLQGKDSEKAKLYLQMGADHFNNREYNKAIEATQEALKYDPSLAAAYNHLALIYMETKRYARSEESFLQALRIQPNYPEVHNNLGVLFNRQNKYQAAIQYFEKAIDSEAYRTPENAYTNMGYSYYRLGDLKKAKTNHQKALDIVPQFCLAHKNLGDVYAKEKSYRRAQEYYENAVTNCPLYQEGQYKLALVMMKQGQKKVAKNQLQDLVQKHKNGPYVDRSTEVLKYLK